MWGPILGLPYPVPMVGAIATAAGVILILSLPSLFWDIMVAVKVDLNKVISILTVIHFKLPTPWRLDLDFRRRLR